MSIIIFVHRTYSNIYIIDIWDKNTGGLTNDSNNIIKLKHILVTNHNNYLIRIKIFTLSTTYDKK